MKLEKKGMNRYLLPARGDMKTPALFYLQEDFLEGASADNSMEQLALAASLPGTVAALGMPDIHSGFGLPIGGVLVGDAKEGLISAGAVGMDINCGVRLLRTGLKRESLGTRELRALLTRIEEVIPAGVGKQSALKEIGGLNREEILTGGAKTAVREGFGEEEDLACCEEGGRYPGADPGKISARALKRAHQLGTIGGGNHFIEFGLVQEVYEAETAALFGLEEGDITLMVHTGSRGLGHQICTDYTDLMFRQAKTFGLKLPNRGLAAVPVDSREGRDYLAAMSCAVNFAFANRQIISHYLRQALREFYREARVRLIYDVAHNIAKFEEVEGKPYLIHRKGATRALPPGHPQNPARYMDTGHPAIIPGTMGTSSYVVTGTGLIGETYNSVNHGAGRTMSRTAAKKAFSAADIAEQLDDVLLSTRDWKAVIDEAPLAYKNIDNVVNTLADIGLTKKILRLKPLAVIKGAG